MNLHVLPHEIALIVLKYVDQITIAEIKKKSTDYIKANVFVDYFPDWKCPTTNKIFYLSDVYITHNRKLTKIYGWQYLPLDPKEIKFLN